MRAAVVSAEERRLAQLAVAQQALVEARTLPEVKQIRDVAAALQQYAKQQRASLAIQNDAAELKLRAERRAGELLAEADKARGGRPPQNRSHAESGLRLHDLGIDRNQSHRWQQEAALPQEAFEAYITTTKARGQELTSKGVYDRARSAEQMAYRRAKITAEQAPLPPDLVTLYHGDFATHGATLADASVDLLLTDPPYGQEWVPQMDALGALAARVLKPGGSLLVLYGQRALRAALEPKLPGEFGRN